MSHQREQAKEAEEVVQVADQDNLNRTASQNQKVMRIQIRNQIGQTVKMTMMVVTVEVEAAVGLAAEVIVIVEAAAAEVILKMTAGQTEIAEVEDPAMEDATKIGLEVSRTLQMVPPLHLCNQNLSPLH